MLGRASLFIQKPPRQALLLTYLLTCIFTRRDERKPGGAVSYNERGGRVGSGG